MAHAERRLCVQIPLGSKLQSPYRAPRGPDRGPGLWRGAPCARRHPQIPRCHAAFHRPALCARHWGEPEAAFPGHASLACYHLREDELRPLLAAQLAQGNLSWMEAKVKMVFKAGGIKRILPVQSALSTCINCGSAKAIHLRCVDKASGYLGGTGATIGTLRFRIDAMEQPIGHT